MDLTIATVLIAFAGVFLICFMKGAFGGGFSIVGIPLLSFVMDPVTAGARGRRTTDGAIRTGMTDLHVTDLEKRGWT